jgi:hypothetical protein
MSHRPGLGRTQYTRIVLRYACRDVTVSLQSGNTLVTEPLFHPSDTFSPIYGFNLKLRLKVTRVKTMLSFSRGFAHDTEALIEWYPLAPEGCGRDTLSVWVWPSPSVARTWRVWSPGFASQL